MRKASAVILITIFSLRCSDFGPENSGKVVVSTDSRSYTASEKITFTVQNLSSVTAYMWACNYRLGYGIEKAENGIWKTFKDRNMACIAIYRSGPMPMVAGRPYTDTLSLATAGLYRLVMDVGWDREHIREIQIYSDEFRIE